MLAPKASRKRGLSFIQKTPRQQRRPGGFKADTYPHRQIKNPTHNNITQTFNCYFHMLTAYIKEKKPPLADGGLMMARFISETDLK